MQSPKILLVLLMIVLIILFYLLFLFYLFYLFLLPLLHLLSCLYYQYVAGIDGEIVVAGIVHLEASVTLHCLNWVSETEMDIAFLEMGAAYDAEISAPAAVILY